jgi:hypothetical protein
MQMGNGKRATCALVILWAVTPHLIGADISKGDVFGQGGYYSELGDGGGTWPVVGGGAGANIGRHFAVFVEGNYVRPSTKLGGFSGTGNLYQAGAGSRIYIPVRHERVRPYVPVVGGFLRGNATAAQDGVSFAKVLASGAYVGAGFGTEIGIGQRFGLRPEFRYFREFWYPQYGQGSQNNGVRTTIGVYYRFGVH